QTVDEDTVVNFDGSSSSDNVGIVSYSWDFNASDGISVDATGATTTHTYTEPGTYTVTLNVSDDAGNYATDTLIVTVNDTTAPSDIVDLTIEVQGVDLLLNWTEPNDNVAVSHYNIYRSTNVSITGTLISQPISGVHNFTDLSVVGDGNIYYYIVVPVDTSGNIGNFSNKVSNPEFSFKSGMNLISLSIIPNNNSIDAMLPQNISYHPIIEISKRKSSGQYVISRYYPDFDIWWSADPTFTTIEIGEGYWFKMEQPVNLTFTGTVNTLNGSIVMNDGMNLIGWPSSRIVAIEEAVPQNLTYHPVIEISERMDTGQYRIVRYYPDFDIWWSANGLDSLTPGKGYWFKVSGEFTWNYTP
ncbi:MAG: PKD domain-containing protein, partial [Bacteroidales bacterium]|nr:PKD domain-containing protein [Bacteroidales bacterium]